MRTVHAGFLVSWCAFIYVVNIIQPSSTGAPEFFPVTLGMVAASEIGLALFLRSRFIATAEAALRSNPEDRAAAAKWMRGQLLSLVLAETVTLFGLVLKVLGFGWSVIGVFFGAGLLLLLLWMPRKIHMIPRGVR